MIKKLIKMNLRLGCQLLLLKTYKQNINVNV